MKCLVQTCIKDEYCGGYCNSHYLKLQRHGDPEFKKALNKDLKCSVQDCENKRYAREYCTKHHMKLKRTGTLLPVKHKGPKPSELSQLDSMKDPRPGYRGYYAANTVDDIRNKARTRGKEWNISSVDAYKLIIAECTYCGYQPNWPESRVGIDRTDSSKGYIPGNCVSCCSRCNSAKNDMTTTEFKEWLVRAYLHITKPSA